jgi:hypothetical protein
MLSAADELNNSAKTNENPSGTLPIGSPEIVFPVSPLLISVTMFIVCCGMDPISATQTRQAFGSWVLPYYLVMGRYKVGGVRTWTTWYPFTTALPIIILTILLGKKNSTFISQYNKR